MRRYSTPGKDAWKVTCIVYIYNCFLKNNKFKIKDMIKMSVQRSNLK